MADVSWLKQTEKAFAEIREAQSEIDVLHGFIVLSKIWDDLKLTKSAQDFCKEMVRMDFIGLLPFQNEFRAKASTKIILGMIKSMTAFSNELCKNIISKNLHIQFVKFLESKSVNKESRKKSLDVTISILGAENVEKNLDVTISILGALFNILRNYPESQPTIRETGVQATLRDFLSRENVTMKALTVWIFCYVLDWRLPQDQDLVKAVRKSIDFMVNQLLAKFTLPSDWQAKLTQGTLQNLEFTADEVFGPMACVAYNRQITVELLKQGAISKCECILLRIYGTETFGSDSESFTNRASKAALTLLERMSQHGIGNELIDFPELLMKFNKHPIDEIRDISGRLLQIPQLKDEAEKLSPDEADDIPLSLRNITTKMNTDGGDDLDCSKMNLVNPEDLMENIPKKHIMISYSHNEKAVVKKMVADLRKKIKVEIWIDEDKMHTGQGLVEEMAQAVDNASCVICCYSDAYAKSKNCMLEFEYAQYTDSKNIVYLRVQENCEPKGKLGMYLAGKFYFDLSTNSKYDKNFPRLVQKLEAAHPE